ncbi:MAG: adenylosuccinate lyase, partial [Opitutales bacterium]|nr:adenylosuccinate lyase [Opitutales bacterium]
LTECVEQLQVYKSLEVILIKSVSALGAFKMYAEKYADFPYAARTHNVIAQLTTLGKRFAMFGEDMIRAVEQLQQLIDTYPVRGIKGAIGTQLDQLTLFNGDAAKAKKLNEIILNHLGISNSFGATGQVYPRSLDFETVSRLYQIASGPSSFAKTLRIMAGHELAGEGFAKGQTGSSAMPHKMNSRSCERLNGFVVILRGFLEMGASLAGDQWNEGDVSCSVVRRVMLPDSFFAIDGLLETFLTIARQMEINTAVIEAECDKYMPFLLTTTVMMQAVKNGMGREDAHEVIKEHAVATLRDLRAGKITSNNLFERLANDERMPLDKTALDAILTQGRTHTGMAKEQALNFAERVQAWLDRYPEAKSYTPAPIL